MKIEEPTWDQMRDVAMRMRDSDFREFEACSFASTREGLADLLMEHYGLIVECIMATHDDRPVAIGAMIERTPNVAALLFFATDEFPLIAAPLTRFIRQRLFAGIKKAGCHRIECVSIDGHDKAHRWIKALGLKREFIIPGRGKRGEAFHQFAWVKETTK